ncbi:hypothetical protein NKDENANG_01206 [Candidatus Entotheonellaceae bacterium PAL068K]
MNGEMRKIRLPLPFWFMLPAMLAVLLFFVIPVVLTFVYSFTTMSSDTGVLGNRYIVTDATITALRQNGLDPILVRQLQTKAFVFDEAGLAALRASRLQPAVVQEVTQKLAGKVYTSEKQLFADLKQLTHRLRSFKDRKAVSKAVARTIKNREFLTAAAFRAGLESIDVEVTPEVFERLLALTNTSWKWTLGNYRELLASQFTLKMLSNTAWYVFCTLFLNVGLALVLALTTFYIPQRQSTFFRAVWLIPRISPSVIYVLLWKWLTFDSGFMSYVLAWFGITPQNWLLEYPWTSIIFINGFVGASMGMIIFASAMQAISKEVLYAAEVDGAYPWQQVRRIILPLMTWPILFITSYQTLSLMTSFEYIQLSTDGGPGFYTTETWALHAFHMALSNYFGNLRYGYGATLAVVLVLVGVALSLLYLRFFNFKELVAEPLIEN